jgi:hypothetical protein
MVRSVEYTGAVSGVDVRALRAAFARAAPAGAGTAVPREPLKVDSGKVSRKVIVLARTVERIRRNSGLVAVSSRDTWQGTGGVAQRATLPTVFMNSNTSSCVTFRGGKEKVTRTTGTPPMMSAPAGNGGSGGYPGDGGEYKMRIPQSLQSVPKAQSSNSAPGPPSSQVPSSINEQ